MSTPIDFTTAPPPPPITPQAGGPLGFSGSMSDTIADMRWNGDPIAAQLFRDFGCYQPVQNDRGEYELKRVEGMQPIMNDKGIWRMVSIVHSNINAVTSLSNIDDERADIYVRQTLYRLIKDIAINDEEWEIKQGDKGTIMSVMTPLIFFQSQRPVGGHESSASAKQIFEHNVQQHLTTPQQQGGFSLFGWKKN